MHNSDTHSITFVEDNANCRPIFCIFGKQIRIQNLKPRHMNSPEIKKYIREHSNLFWYTPEDKKEEISTEFLVETILNYGDKHEVIQLFDLMGINKVAQVFFDSINLSDRRKGNYHEITINYFTLVFNKYAQRNN